MNTASAIIFLVAQELAKQAKDSLPALQCGEQIIKERYENGIYSRETTLDGDIFLSQYDFWQRKSRRVAVREK